MKALHMLTVWGTIAFKGGILSRIHRGEEALPYINQYKIIKYKSMHKLTIQEKEKKKATITEFSCW